MDKLGHIGETLVLAGQRTLVKAIASDQSIDIDIAVLDDGNIILAVSGEIVWTAKTGPVVGKGDHDPHDLSSWGT